MTGYRLGGIAFGLAVLAMFAAALATPLGDWTSLAGLRQTHSVLVAEVAAHPLRWGAGFFVATVAATALSFPAGPVIGVAAGLLFGFWPALAIVAVATPIGSTFAFLASRLWLRSWVERRFVDRLAELDRGLERHGPLYLLALRLNPFVPYWLVNLTAGVTAMRLRAYVPVTAIGLFPAFFLYVAAGSQLAEMSSVAELVPVEAVALLFLLSLALLALPRSRRSMKVGSA